MFEQLTPFFLGLFCGALLVLAALYVVKTDNN